MRKAEQKVWDSMKRASKRLCPRIWMQRIENIAGDGMPDVFISGNSRSAWVELKAAKLPKRATTKLQMTDGVRQSQINWHRKAATVGLVSYVLIRVEGKLSEPLLLDGGDSDGINIWSWDEARAHAVAIGWEAIFERLMS